VPLGRLTLCGRLGFHRRSCFSGEDSQELDEAMRFCRDKQYRGLFLNQFQRDVLKEQIFGRSEDSRETVVLFVGHETNRLAQ
jgi:hypothetical protein